MAILKTEELTYVYSQGTPFEKTAVDHVNLEIEKGEFVGVIGHTGSGKSTTVSYTHLVSENISHRHPLTAMIWTNEEGSLYPPAMMCSGIVCYDYLPEDIRSKFRYEDMMKSQSILDSTKTFGEALEKSGFKGNIKYRISPEKYQYMFETHIEQGPILEDAGNDIGVVDCVLGLSLIHIYSYVADGNTA